MSELSRAPVPKKVRKIKSIDFTFLIVVLMLLAYGLIMVFSASSASAHYLYGDAFYFIKRQFLWALVGLVAMFFTSRLNYKLYYKFALPILLIAIVLLILVKIPGIGQVRNGARRWLGFGPLTFQPSEIAKYALIIFLAKSLPQNQDNLKKFWTGFVPYLVVIGVVAGLVLIEPHMSGTMIILMIGVLMLFLAGAKIWHFVVLALPAVGAVAAMIAISPYRMQRFLTFLDPFSDILGDSWQVVQSLYAIGSGGIFGLGLGQSRQKFLYLPEPQNDFIFSIICEELGFFGALLVIVLFVILLWKGIKIAMHAPDAFSGMLVGGITALIGIQVLMNIAVVTSSMPATGIPLPFFSYGGTSLLFILCGMGIILNVSRYIEK